MCDDIIINMKFEKSSLTVDGGHVRLSMPFEKVDRSKRLVSGFATLDNIDTEGDVVLAEASASAFARARGNIREMHQPIAVGKLVNFREDEHFDVSTNKLYRGVYVTAYISKGAEDTWEKVLDGTLTGFSIGGEIKEVSNEFVKEAGRTIRFIKEYDLVELSLVDNPANQLANLMSIEKVAGEVVIKGMIADVEVENVFYCKNDDTVIVNKEDKKICPVCEKSMENAGWFESGADRVEKIKAIISDLQSSNKEDAPISKSEGGVEMTKPIEKASDNVEETRDDEVVDETADSSVDEVSDEEVDETEDADVEEVEDEEAGVKEEISKKIDELHAAITESLSKSHTEVNEKVEALEDKIADSSNKWLAKASELEKMIEGFGEKLETHKARLGELEKSLEKYNSSDAFRKSADVQPAAKNVQSESFWGNAFSGQ